MVTQELSYFSQRNNMTQKNRFFLLVFLSFSFFRHFTHPTMVGPPLLCGRFNTKSLPFQVAMQDFIRKASP
jgi:hypothetical protein